ncbi:uncharacterized protein LOC134273621 isoform X2 [Saccostrea cucullata]|uniref:uncharacterized protein LOC134273621 isoform X2 n=1 Tax=Saccostrea cuccullata TaxID=36930 RepID=UPI002ED45694
MEMQEIAKDESEQTLAAMGPVVEDLSVCPLPDASPSIRQVFSTAFNEVTGDDAADQNKGDIVDVGDDEWEDLPNEGSSPPMKHHYKLKKKEARKKTSRSSKGTKRALYFPCKSRSGMTVALDTA